MTLFEYLMNKIFGILPQFKKLILLCVLLVRLQEFVLK